MSLGQWSEMLNMAWGKLILGKKGNTFFELLIAIYLIRQNMSIEITKHLNEMKTS